MRRYLDAEKALEVIVYISQSTDNLFNIVKTLYYADKYHLEEYGSLITGETYIAMEDGPVPSGAYDLIKIARGDNQGFDKDLVDIQPIKSIRVQRVNDKTIVTPLRHADLDLLSESDIECLDKAIKKYANMDTKKLWKIVHREVAYNETDRDDPIPLREIIYEDIPAGEDVIAYLDS
jgi:uncharacterized phage-associated protein